MTLLQQMADDRTRHREALRQATREQLRAVLAQVIPAQTAIVFGSLLKAGDFSEASDIDLALAHEPSDMTIYQLTSVLAERMGRRVDVVVLPECRFRDRILREGETWMPQA